MKMSFGKRGVALLLAFVILLTVFPADIFPMVYSSETGTAAEKSYTDQIGKTAHFDKEAWDNYIVSDQPFAYDGSAVDDDKIVEAVDIPDDLTFVIADVYHEKECCSLWYKLSAAPNCTMPKGWNSSIWVFQNWTDFDDNPDSLIVSEPESYVFDANGDVLTSAVVIPSKKVELRAESTLLGGVEYQWQVCYDVENDLWVDIHGENAAELNMSYGMLANAADENGKAYVRVVSKSAELQAISEPIPVTVTESLPKGFMLGAPRSVEPESEDTVTITIQFVYGANGEPVAEPRVYEVQKGSKLSDSFKLPEKEGYSAYLKDDTETIWTEVEFTDVIAEADHTFTFRYWPAKVNYTVIYYWQHNEDDYYTEHERYTAMDFTGMEITPESRSYDGFYLSYIESVPLASDGSTVINVYYDREYYKMMFHLGGGHGVEPVYARYGAELKIPTPSRADHLFVGWDDITDGTGDGIQDLMPKTLPAHHTVWEAIWKLEKPTVTVTIVHWGQNANDDEYSYISSHVLEVKPGTAMEFGSGDFVCELEEHQHGQNCEYDCGIEPHTHSLSNNCYELTCIKTGHDHESEGCSAGNCTHECGFRCWISGKCTHTHTDSCYTCGEKNGTHTHTLAAGCYKLTCTTEEHTHNAECYACIEHIHTEHCYLAMDCLDEKLWVFNAEKSDKEHTALPGQANIINAYYDRTTFDLIYKYGSGYGTTDTISEKWGTHILDQYNAITEKAGGYMWSENTSDGPYTNYFGVMPQPYMKDGELVKEETYYLHTFSGSTQNGLVYFLADKDGNYVEKFRTTWKSGSSNNFTVSEEDFFEFEGYVINETLSADVGDYCKSFPEFYYDRRVYTLTINDGKENLDPIYIPYEANIGEYLNFTPEPPDIYPQGSVEFAGWYLEEHGAGEPFDPSIHTMKAKNLYLYAIWKPVQCDVRFYLDETLVGTNEIYQATVDGDTITYQYSIPYGSHVQDPYTPPGDPTKGQYLFVGWFYTNDHGMELLWDFHETQVTGDTDIYAKWNSNVSVDYSVRFVWIDENGQEVEIAEPVTGKARGGTSKTFEAKGAANLYGDYYEGYFPNIKSHTIVMDLDHPENNHFTFYYTQENSVPYTVYYRDAATGEDLLPPREVTDNKMAAVTEEYVRIDGYLPDTHRHTLIVVPGGENEIVFNYTEDNVNGMYLVHYWIQNENGDGYIKHSEFEGRAEKGTKVDALAKDIEHFVFDASHPQNVTSGTISVDNVLELHMYYDRNQYPYKVQYFERYTNRELLPTKFGTAYWGSSVTELAPAAGTGALEHFSLISAPELSIEIAYDLVENTTVNVITFYYAENRVNLHYVAGEGGTVSTQTESVRISGGSARGSVATAAAGYAFEGWYSDPGYSDLVSTDPAFAPTKAADALWADGTTYYAKFKRSITSMTISVSGSEDIDENQTFLFQITGTDGVNMTVTVHGNSSATVTGVTVGNEYTVTQLNDAWRYTPDAAQKKITVGADAAANAVTFTQSRTDEQWLDGNNWLDNLIRSQNT